MGDAEFIMSFAGGFVGLLSAALVYHVYQTSTDLEKRWHAANGRMQKTVQAFQSVESNLAEIKEKLASKASYQQTEKRLAEATSKLMLKDKQNALTKINKGIHVHVS